MNAYLCVALNHTHTVHELDYFNSQLLYIVSLAVHFENFLSSSTMRKPDQVIVGNQLTANRNSTSIKPHACEPSTGGFTHTNREIKNSIEFQWTPLTGTGFVFFIVRFLTMLSNCMFLL